MVLVKNWRKWILGALTYIACGVRRSVASAAFHADSRGDHAADDDG